MNKREALQLARQIERDDSQCRVTGTRVYTDNYRRQRSYGIDVVDTRTGDSYVVNDVDEWAERKKAVEYAKMDLAQYEAAE